MLWDHHEAMFQSGVNLVIGAHAHQYNRIYPYYKTQKYKKKESPYRDDEEYIVSIVEGVAGSNTDLVLQMPAIYDFTASYTANQTGFGVMTVNYNNQIKYEHFSTKEGLTDSMVIEKVRERKVKGLTKQ